MTTTPARLLLDPTDVAAARDILDTMPTRAWETSSPVEIIEYVFNRLGYTIHHQWESRSDLTTHTWLLQNRSGEWLVFEVTPSTAKTPGRSVPPSQRWTQATVEAKRRVLLIELATDFEVLRAADPGGLFLDIVSISDAHMVPALRATIDWMRTHAMLDTDAMLFLAAMTNRPIYLDILDGPSAPVEPSEPLTDFGPDLP